MARSTPPQDVFTAVAEPQRRQILTALASGERSVNELADLLQFRQPQTSKHLQVLKEVGLVDVRSLGQQRLYQLNGERLKVIQDWVEALEQLWTSRFKRLDTLLEHLQQTPSPVETLEGHGDAHE
ncbi:ArsR/SmtB family transcription factor [Deinococcus alpinitundrae]|uniref:ArsR/SmtB family transcription factor n=1 Tax=Deinococcus alpinitundrae TaxID=468913 RepID=UPI001379C0F1|nr:metalloregulator ArsR/SmtB family transcription factor [Deinococcus alpinitundrae]